MNDEEKPLLTATPNPESPMPLPMPSADLESVFQNHGSQVFGAAYRVTGSAQDAEDVLQTVFLRLLRRADLDLSPSPAGYLHRAAVNAALDLMRARQRARSVPLDDFDLPSEAGVDDPERRQQDRETRRRLRQAILTLSEKSAELFSLRYLEGWSNQEIARSLGMTQTAVAVSLHRSRAQVKAELAKSELADAPGGN